MPGRLDGLHDEFAPGKIVGGEQRTLNRRETIGARWDSGVDRMFGFLMTNRTNNLSRSVTFKQAYWREAERLVGFADTDAKAAIVAQAREAGIGRRAIQRMERVKSTGQASVDEVDLWEIGRAHV